MTDTITLPRAELQAALDEMDCLISYAEHASNGSDISWADVAEDIGEDAKAKSKTLRARLAEKEQEPCNGKKVSEELKRLASNAIFAAAGMVDCDSHAYQELLAAIDSFAVRMDSPPQREWQGLTDEELCDVCEALGVTVAGPASEAINALFRAIEAKLKEKNK